MSTHPPASVEIPRSHGLVREGILVSALSIASKLLGVVREGLMAWAFGTSAVIDAFRVAQSGTFILIHIFGGSVLDSAFLPTFKHLHSSGHPRLAWRTVALAARALALVGIALSLVLTIGGRVWAGLLAPGFDPERIALTAALFAAMALALPLGLGSNLAITVSNGLYRFRVPALRALVQNLAILLGILATLATGTVLLLGFSIPLAQLAMLFLVVVSLRAVARPRAGGSQVRDSLVWRFFGLSLIPGFGLVLLEQSNLVVERIVASHLPAGSIASIDYARFLVETPLVTLGVGVTQTLLPTLSDLSAVGDRVRFERSIRTLLLACLWALLPVSVWLLGFGEDLIRVVYARGAFDEQSVRTTTQALSGFAFGLWAWFGGTVLQRAFYAQRRLRMLLPLTALGLLGFILLATLWAPRMGVRGISAAFSVSNLVFFCGSLLCLGWGFARSVFPVLAYMLAGAGFLYLLGPGIVPSSAPLARLLLGAFLIGSAWLGLTGLHPTTRVLALGLLRILRRAA